MKKLLAAMITMSLLFSPVGDFVFQDHSTTVEAKSYRSGKRSFNSNIKKPSSNSFFNKSNTTRKSYTKSSKKRGFFSGGLMRGLMIGGLAGLLFGGLFANMGILGSFLGLMINILAIYFLLSIIRSIFTMLRRKRREDSNPWKR